VRRIGGTALYRVLAGPVPVAATPTRTYSTRPAVRTAGGVFELTLAPDGRTTWHYGPGSSTAPAYSQPGPHQRPAGERAEDALRAGHRVLGGGLPGHGGRHGADHRNGISSQWATMTLGDTQTDVRGRFRPWGNRAVVLRSGVPGRAQCRPVSREGRWMKRTTRPVTPKTTAAMLPPTSQGRPIAWVGSAPDW
jgi:hypothetical protein